MVEEPAEGAPVMEDRGDDPGRDFLGQWLGAGEDEIPDGLNPIGADRRVGQHFSGLIHGSGVVSGMDLPTKSFSCRLHVLNIFPTRPSLQPMPGFFVASRRRANGLFFDECVDVALLVPDASTELHNGKVAAVHRPTGKGLHLKSEPIRGLGSG